MGSSGMKLGFWRLTATAGIENTWNQPIWHISKKVISQPNLVISPVWISFIIHEVTKSRYHHGIIDSPVGLFALIFRLGFHSTNEASSTCPFGFSYSPVSFLHRC
jgi:hypothetical protein